MAGRAASSAPASFAGRYIGRLAIFNLLFICEAEELA
jgi:hypothetical protein